MLVSTAVLGQNTAAKHTASDKHCIHRLLAWFAIKISHHYLPQGVLISAAAESAALPELDKEGWTSDDFVRDMPVDYTLLVENLLDPGLLLCKLSYAAHSTLRGCHLYPCWQSQCALHKMQHCCWAMVCTSPACPAGIGASVIVSEEGNYRVQPVLDLT